jgi:hypothetical protein
MRLKVKNSIHFATVHRHRTSGTSIVETMIAIAVVGVFLASVYAVNSQVWLQMRSTVESVAATRCLNGRNEQLRASTWTQVTDPNYLRDSILSVPPDSGGDLAGSLVETIDVTAYLAPLGTVTPMQVRRNSSGVATVVNAGDGTMLNQTSARLNVTATWTAADGRSRTRQITLIAGQGGILGRN